MNSHSTMVPGAGEMSVIKSFRGLERCLRGYEHILLLQRTEFVSSTKWLIIITPVPGDMNPLLTSVGMTWHMVHSHTHAGKIHDSDYVR